MALTSASQRFGPARFLRARTGPRAEWFASLDKTRTQWTIAWTSTTSFSSTALRGRSSSEPARARWSKYRDGGIVLRRPSQVLVS